MLSLSSFIFLALRANQYTQDRVAPNGTSHTPICSHRNCRRRHIMAIIRIPTLHGLTRRSDTRDTDARCRASRIQDHQRNTIINIHKRRRPQTASRCINALRTRPYNTAVLCKRPQPRARRDILPVNLNQLLINIRLRRLHSLPVQIAIRIPRRERGMDVISPRVAVAAAAARIPRGIPLAAEVRVLGLPDVVGSADGAGDAGCIFVRCDEAVEGVCAGGLDVIVHVVGDVPAGRVAAGDDDVRHVGCGQGGIEDFNEVGSLAAGGLHAGVGSAEKC
jgi:hypothetical protein